MIYSPRNTLSDTSIILGELHQFVSERAQTRTAKETAGFVPQFAHLFNQPASVMAVYVHRAKYHIMPRTR
jgi:hypothetical protein